MSVVLRGEATAFAALVRAVNVGGTGRLAMADLAAACAEAGGTTVRTYRASGNALFRHAGEESAVAAAIEARLAKRLGRPARVLLRTAAEMAAVLARDPFPDAPPARVMAIFLPRPPPATSLDTVTGRTDETVCLGAREIYVHYPCGAGRSGLRIAAAAEGTARNMATVAALARMLADI